MRSCRQRTADPEPLDRARSGWEPGCRRPASHPADRSIPPGRAPWPGDVPSPDRAPHHRRRSPMPRSHHLGARAVGAHRLLATTAATAALTLILAACGGTGTGDAGSDSAGRNGRAASAAVAPPRPRRRAGSSSAGPAPTVPCRWSPAPHHPDDRGHPLGGDLGLQHLRRRGPCRRDRLASDGFAVTEMYCMDDDVMESEAAYLAALQAATQVTLGRTSSC
jgi:hypothetical protein